MEEPQKLFKLPGTIEEEEERELDTQGQQQQSNDNPHQRPESPLLSQKNTGTNTIPRNITLVRVSTQSSSIGGVGRQDSYRSRYRAGPVRKIRRRAVLKNGECNVLQSRISRRSLRFLQDIFTTLVDTQWRWTLLCFTLSFVLSWLLFAVIWWLIAFTHGDFDEKHLPPIQAENNWTPCVYNIFSFTSCFLFSIETQHTIGYGSRSTTEECPEAIFVMCIQSIAGVMIQAFMVGIVFAKMSRPKQRTQTLLFSRNAVICQRDGDLCLMFRVADMRKSHIIGATMRAQVIKTRTTKEGEVLGQNQQELTIGTDGTNGNIFFIWPMTIIHRINSESPFHNMSAEDMLTERFEVVVILEGTIESTGQTTQARSSYLPQEILWGHRFEPMVCYSKERQSYEVDYSLFNTTTQVDTPLCSSRELGEFYRLQDDMRHGTGFIVDDEVMSMEPYHDVHHYTNNHRATMIGPNHSFIARAESTKSDNSLEEHGAFNRIIYRDAHSRIPSPHLIYHPQRELLSHEKSIDIDNDAIQIIGEVELQHLPEAVSREIIKNSREIIFEEEPRESEPLLSREGSSSSMRPVISKRTAPIRYPVLLDEEKRLLSDSKRNLSFKNFPLVDEEKRSLNGSRRNLNGSKRYVLVSVDKAECWNGSARNLNTSSKDNLINARRHTGSKERLNAMKNSKKVGKELLDSKIKRKLIDVTPSEYHMPAHVAIEMEKTKQTGQQFDMIRERDSNLTPSSLSDFITLPSEIIVAQPSIESPVTPESGFAEGQLSNSSPESSKRQTIQLPNDSNVFSRNRRSYEHAQLQDVNDILTRTSSGSSCSDSDSASKEIAAENLYSKEKNPSPKPSTRQIISYTSV